MRPRSLKRLGSAASKSSERHELVCCVLFWELEEFLERESEQRGRIESNCHRTILRNRTAQKEHRAGVSTARTGKLQGQRSRAGCLLYDSGDACDGAPPAAGG